jgi:hypothetical protein
MKSSEILQAAKARINTPEKWAKGALARTKNSHVVPTTSRSAACFCSYGAIMVECGETDPEPALAWLWVAVSKRWSSAPNVTRWSSATNIPRWNDSPDTTHADVMHVFSDAIDLAQEAGD